MKRRKAKNPHEHRPQRSGLLHGRGKLPGPHRSCNHIECMGLRLTFGPCLLYLEANKAFWIYWSTSLWWLMTSRHGLFW
jgi:hypothetical protein